MILEKITSETHVLSMGIHCKWHEKNYERDEKGNPSMIESDKPASDTVELH